MKKEEFIELYHAMTLKELCKHLSCSVTLIYGLLDKYKIPRKGNKYRDYSHLREERKRRIELET